jgi:ligand-binding SRPBCC domain-containing protein
MPHFTRILELPGVPAERLWAFHERPDALQLLIPVGGPIARRRLEHMFDHRHAVTKALA